MLIREAQPDDAAGIYRAHAESGSDDPMAWDDVEECRRHVAWLLRVGYPPIVAEVDGEIAGEMEVWWGEDVPEFGRTLDISVLYLHETMQRQGIGSALVLHAFELAREHACDWVSVWADAGAVDFYGKHGLVDRLRVVRFTTTPPAGAASDVPHVPVRLADLATPDGADLRTQRILHPVQRWLDLVREQEERDVDALLMDGSALAVYRRAWWRRERETAELYLWSPTLNRALVEASVAAASGIGVEKLSMQVYGKDVDLLREMGFTPGSEELVLAARTR